MALCPWCKVEVGELPTTSPCPRCKRVAIEHPWLNKSAAPPPLASGLFGTGVELERDSKAPHRSESPAPFVIAPSGPLPPMATLELDLPPAHSVRAAALTETGRPSPYAPTEMRMSSTPMPVPSFESELDLGGPAPAAVVTTAPSVVQSAAPPPPPQPQPAISLPAPAPSGRSILDDDDELMGGDLALDLDVGGSAALPSSLSSPRISAAPQAARSLPPMSNGRVSHVPQAPQSGSAPPLGVSDIDPFEARALADFGEPPNNPFVAPLYALRVFRRRAELTRLVALRKEEAARAHQRAEDALIAFAERVRPAAEQAGSRALETVRAAEELMKSRDSGMATEMDTHRAQTAGVDERLAEVEVELAAAQAEEKRIVEELARAVEVKQRAEAKLKRAEIEIRNAMQMLEQKGGS